MNDQVTESFKCSETLSKQIAILAQLHGLDGKSEYIRHLILSDLQKQQGKASLFKQLELIDGNNKG